MKNHDTVTSIHSSNFDHDGNFFELIQKVCKKIPPLWPLKNFVAVNPFLGLSDLTFAEACQTIYRITDSGMLMQPEFYKKQFKNGDITESDLAEALSELNENQKFTVQDLINVIHKNPSYRKKMGLNCADAIDQINGTKWNNFFVEEISKWCAAYYDEGQSSWRMPWRSLELYQAWKQAVLIDRTPQVFGISGFRRQIALLPDNPLLAIKMIVHLMEINTDEMEEFLHRQLISISGWSSYIQYRVREKLLHGGEEDNSLIQLLAIRLAYDFALFMEKDHKIKFLRSKIENSKKNSSHVALLVLWQRAYEFAFQRKFIHTLTTKSLKETTSNDLRKDIQAIFCIDVRSERIRRWLEFSSSNIETIGFAGFFGFPIEYISSSQVHGSAHCPALIKPQFRIRETIKNSTPHQVKKILYTEFLKRRVGYAWKAFKISAISCFSFVETIGLFYGLKLFKDGFCLKNSLFFHTKLKFSNKVETVPQIDQDHLDNESNCFGIPEADQILLAERALRAMSLTKNFARIIFICGHGSTTANNPYGSSLDCGACGGNSGDINARIATNTFNSPKVRIGLKERGIHIPDDTWFIAGLHNTTTDKVEIFDIDRVPLSHKKDLEQLDFHLKYASDATRVERSSLLGLGKNRAQPLNPHSTQSSKRAMDKLHRKIETRSYDWSQVRPEWGLAGNAAFIAAPRSFTKNLNLEGRVFLHDYDEQSDLDGDILELIMSAPMVVASWINLQYYASTVNNSEFGSGNKVLHNVTSLLGVIQGNGGDLQVGLPFQSLHNGKRFIHEPLKLNVFVAAPKERINRVITKQEHVRQLVDHGWVHLFAIKNNAQECDRYISHLNWRSM